MLAPLKSTDSPDVTRQKINEVARYMETFAVRRSINFRNFGASSIRYTMYTLVKELRGKDIESLRALLQGKLNEMEETWDGIGEFRLHGMNRYFVKFLLSRITGFIEQQSGLQRASRLTSSVPGQSPTRWNTSGRTSLTSTGTSSSSSMSSTPIATESAIWCCCRKARTNPMAQ